MQSVSLHSPHGYQESSFLSADISDISNDINLQAFGLGGFAFRSVFCCPAVLFLQLLIFLETFLSTYSEKYQKAKAKKFKDENFSDLIENLKKGRMIIPDTVNENELIL